METVNLTEIEEAVLIEAIIQYLLLCKNSHSPFWELDKKENFIFLKNFINIINKFNYISKEDKKVIYKIFK